LKKYNVYLPEFLGVILALLLLNLWYISSIAIENQILPVNFDYLYKGTTVLIGAFVGAFSAYKLNSKKEEIKEHTQQKLAMNKAIFVSIRQINAVENMQKEFSEYSTELDRAFKLPAMKPPCYDGLKYDFDGLSFLLEDYPQVMMNLVVEQERFEQVFNSIDIRNNFYVNDVQPALSKLELESKNISIAAFSKALGERLFEGAIGAADSMYYHVETTSESLVVMHNELAAVARKAFPGGKFLKLESEVIIGVRVRLNMIPWLNIRKGRGS